MYRDGSALSGNGPGGHSHPGLFAPQEPRAAAVPAAPALSTHDANEAIRLAQMLTAEVRARRAAHDVEGTWSAVFVPCIWLAGYVHRLRTLIPTLEALAVRRAPFQALGEHFDGLGLYTPESLSAWITSLLLTGRLRTSGRSRSAPSAP